MYAMLTGCFPFKGEDKESTYFKILKLDYNKEKLNDR